MKRDHAVRVLLGLLVCATSLGQGAAKPALCDEFKALGWPHTNGLGKFMLSDTEQHGASATAQQTYYNLDLDGDDREDVVSISCPGSAIPADPCSLESALSGGGSIQLEAWRMYLVRHHGRIYAITSELTAKLKSRNPRIYRIGPKQAELVCGKP